MCEPRPVGDGYSETVSYLLSYRQSLSIHFLCRDFFQLLVQLSPGLFATRFVGGFAFGRSIDRALGQPFGCTSFL